MNEKPTDLRIHSATKAGVESERLTYDVPEAGRLLGLSRNGAYAAAKAGLIPVLNVGRRKLVPKAALHQMLAAAGVDCQRARELGTGAIDDGKRQSGEKRHDR
jgi:Helix-turn-helix domain